MNTMATLSQKLLEHHIKLVTAESCTAGGLAQTLTSLPGSSAWFDRGFITYTNLSKHEMLDVPLSILENYGAVSQQTAEEMAQGALRNSHAELSIAVTGIAGPDGGTEERPVGMVWFAFATHTSISSQLKYFQGSRTEIRSQAVEFVLQQLINDYA